MPNAHIEVDHRAPAIGVADAFIEAPIETVWGILSDLENWPTWNKSVSKIRATHVWELEEKGQGTQVHTEESFEGLVARLFRGFSRKTLAKALDQGVSALKAGAESRNKLL
jgi:hypothetical protein